MPYKKLCLIAVLILFIAIINIFFGISLIKSESMEPALYDGDWVLFARYSKPVLYGIFFIDHPHDENKKIVKRITRIVSSDYFYVLGDHKGEYWDADIGEMAIPLDSRNFGLVHRSKINGRVALVFWPLCRVGWV